MSNKLNIYILDHSKQAGAEASVWYEAMQLQARNGY